MDTLSLETAFLGALAILGFVVVARIFRKGLGNYSQRQKAMRTRIRKTSAAIREDTHSTPLSEQMALMEAAVRELLLLSGNPSGCSVARCGREELHLHTPRGSWRIRLVLRAANLRGARRTLHAGQWEVGSVQGGDVQTFAELAPLMRYLSGLVHPENKRLEGVDAEPPEFRRRLTH